MDGSCGAAAAGKQAMRVVGGVAAFFAIIAVGIGGGLGKDISYPLLGQWRVNLVILSSALLGMVTMNRGTVILNCVLSIICVVLGLYASTVDGAYSTLTANFKTCYNPSQGEYYGSSNQDYLTSASSCASQYSSNPSQYDCYCIISNFTSVTSSCFVLSGQSDCSNLIGPKSKVHQTLGAAAAFNVFALLSILALSCLTCFSCCCPRNLGPLAGDNFNAGDPYNDYPGSNVVVGGAPTVVVVGDNGQMIQQSGYMSQSYPTAAATTATVVTPQIIQAQAYPNSSMQIESYAVQPGGAYSTGAVPGKVIN